MTRAIVNQILQRRWCKAAALACASVLAGSPGLAQAELLNAETCAPSVTAANQKLVMDAIAESSGGAAVLEDTAAKFFSKRYIQHSPGVENGPEAFVQYHKEWYKTHSPPKRGSSDITGIVAECDYVLIMHKRPRPDPDHPGKTYDSFSFDMWRIVGGKLDEHWDSAIEPFRQPQ